MLLKWSGTRNTSKTPNNDRTSVLNLVKTGSAFTTSGHRYRYGYVEIVRALHHAARKVVGVGSVGLLAFVILMQGRDPDDLIVLQAKQAVHSVLEPFTAPAIYPLAGERVVAGQQLMQAASDIFLGWVRGGAGRDYYIRQLRDMKYSPDPTTFTAEMLRGYALLCGRTLARGHARLGDARHGRSDRDTRLLHSGRGPRPRRRPG